MQLKDDPKSEVGAESPVTLTVLLGFEHRALRDSDDVIHLDLCSPFELVVARTRKHVYQLIVLDGAVGDVLVRGGGKFPTFRRVRFAGSTAGGSAIKLNTIDVGLRMEFHLGHRIVITTPVQAVSRRSTDRDSIEYAVRSATDSAAVPRAH
jgi:hypothetical protein